MLYCIIQLDVDTLSHVLPQPHLLCPVLKLPQVTLLHWHALNEAVTSFVGAHT